MRWSNDAKCKVDDGHVTALGEFTVFTNTFPHVHQPQCVVHGQHHATHNWKIGLLEPRVAELQTVGVGVVSAHIK